MQYCGFNMALFSYNHINSRFIITWLSIKHRFYSVWSVICWYGSTRRELFSILVPTHDCFDYQFEVRLTLKTFVVFGYLPYIISPQGGIPNGKGFCQSHSLKERRITRRPALLRLIIVTTSDRKFSECALSMPLQEPVTHKCWNAELCSNFIIRWQLVFTFDSC